MDENFFDQYCCAGFAGRAGGSRYPRLLPATLPAEDAARAGGHLTLGRAEWAWHLAAHPSHILLNCVAYWADWVGLWQLDNPAFKYLAVLAETLHII